MDTICAGIAARICQPGYLGYRETEDIGSSILRGKKIDLGQLWLPFDRNGTRLVAGSRCLFLHIMGVVVKRISLLHDTKLMESQGGILLSSLSVSIAEIRAVNCNLWRIPPAKFPAIELITLRGACLVPNKARLAGFRSMADAHMRSIMPCHRPIPNNKNCICHVSQEATFYRTPHFIVRERRRDPIPRGGVG